MPLSLLSLRTCFRSWGQKSNIITKDDSIALMSQEITMDFKSFGQELGIKTKTYISYYITISQMSMKSVRLLDWLLCQIITKQFLKPLNFKRIIMSLLPHFPTKLFRYSLCPFILVMCNHGFQIEEEDSGPSVSRSKK